MKEGDVLKKQIEELKLLWPSTQSKLFEFDELDFIQIGFFKETQKARKFYQILLNILEKSK